MATIEVDKKELNRVLKKEFRMDFLLNRLVMMGMPVENVGENNISLEIFPNRPDLLSQYGVARALKNFIGIRKGIQKYKINKSNYKLFVDPKLANIRPFTACCVIKNINFSDEKIRDIIQFQEKLHITICRNRKKAAIGIYPLEKIKFPIYFKAMNPEEIRFTPLDMNREITGKEILVNTEQGIRYADLLKDFKQYPVFIDSNNNILSMPPIINSDSVGKVSARTEDVFIEVSGHNIQFLSLILNILVTSFAEMDGRIHEIDVSAHGKRYKFPDFTAGKMKLDVSHVNKILGLNLKENEIKNLLEKMGLSYNAGIALIPPYRIDILHEYDLIEEIAIAYGYEKFTPKIESFYSIAEQNRFELFKEKFKDLMVGLEFIEISMPHLSNKTNLNEKMNTNKNFVALKNSVNQEYNTLRNWLLPGLMEVLSNNKHNEYPQRMFEIGTVFKENEKISMASLTSHSKANFTEIKQITEYILKSLKIKYEIKEKEDEPCFISGRVAKILVKGKEIGFLGEISPSVLENWHLEQPVAALEIDIEEIFKI